MRSLNLNSVRNVRDLGGIPIQNGLHVSHNLFYRGGALNRLSADDSRVLFEELGIRCVIDLRCGWECEAKPDALPESVMYHHIPFYDMEKVGLEYTHPADGTIMIGHDVACDPDHFYRSLANPLTCAQIKLALNQSFSYAERGLPTYQHCSGGKDRTGIMSLLILTVLGASEETILEDYLLTNNARDKDYDALFRRFLRLANGNEQRAHELVISHRARPENIVAFRCAIDECYGSMDRFVSDTLGFDPRRREQLRETCATGNSRGTRAPETHPIDRLAACL